MGIEAGEQKCAHLRALLALLALLPSPVHAGDPQDVLAGPAGLPAPEALRTLRVVPGFRVELVAHEPMVADPVSIAWDARGRLWVAEMPGYPQGPPAGRVRILEDVDRDGLPDRSVIFSDTLPFPTSIVPHGKGVLVAAAPDIVYLEDQDGDGKADLRRAVLTGFAEGNTQLRVNGLIRGLDGRIYGANGRADGKVRRPGDPIERAIEISRRDFRFDPETFLPEAASGPSQFGHAFDAWGRRFLSWNTIHIRQEALSPSDLERHPALRRTATCGSISDHGDSSRIHALVPPPRTFNQEPTDHFNASCGLTVESGGVFPAPYAGSAFVCEPLVGIVHRDQLEQGSGPLLVAARGEAGSEFLASTDPWFHPVFLRSGPDGALHVVDFYREMVEHPDYVPRELRGGVDFGRGRGGGRIYRILPEGLAPRPVPDLEALSGRALAGRLESPNGWERETAARLITERRDRGAVKEIESIASRSSSAIARTHALWLLHALKALDPRLVAAALGAGEPRLRESALRLAREDRARLGALRGDILRLLADPDPAVRLQAILAAGDLEDAGPGRDGKDRLAVLLARAARGAPGDPWLETAIASSLRGREAEFLAAVVGDVAPGAPRDAFLAEVAALAAASGGREASLSVLALAASLLDQGRLATAFHVAAGAASGLDETTGPGGALLTGPASSVGGAWSRLLRAARSAALDPSEDTALRSTAVSLLSREAWATARPVLEALLDPRGPLDLQVAAARAAGAHRSPDAASFLLGAWAAATPRLRGAILDGLLAVPSRLEYLADAIESGAVSPRDIEPARRGALLAAAGGGRGRLEALLGPGSPGGAPERAALVLRYAREMPERGNGGRGAGIFAERCASCHRFAGGGREVGPDLAGVGKKRREDVLVSILDPGRSVTPGYSPYVVVLDTGEVLTGVIASETGSAITLRRPDAPEETVPRSRIESLSSSGGSLMPEGLETVLSPADAADLLEHLRGADRQ